MPQEFQVLRCYSCHTFQVHQVKKAKKWNCKVCGEKQSLMKVFGQGTGSECRRHTQKLNMVQAEAHERWTVQQEEGHKDGTQTLLDSTSVALDEDDYVDPPRQKSSTSRWSMYLNAEVEEDDVVPKAGDDMYTTDWREFRTTNKSFRSDRCESKMRRERKRTDDYSETGPCNKGSKFTVNCAKKRSASEDKIPRSYTSSAQPQNKFGGGSGIDFIPNSYRVHSLEKTNEQTEYASAYNLDKPVPNVSEMPEIGSGRNSKFPKRLASVGNKLQSKWGKFLAPEAEDSNSSSEEDFEHDGEANTARSVGIWSGGAETWTERSRNLDCGNQENSPPFEGNGECETFVNHNNDEREARTGYFSADGKSGCISNSRTCSKFLGTSNSCNTVPVDGNSANKAHIYTSNSENVALFSLGGTSDDEDFSIDF